MDERWPSLKAEFEKISKIDRVEWHDAFEIQYECRVFLQPGRFPDEDVEGFDNWYEREKAFAIELQNSIAKIDKRPGPSGVEFNLPFVTFSQWENFESGRRANIAEVYESLQRFAVTLIVGESYSFESADSCGGKPGCAITGRSRLPVAGGIRVIRRRFTAGLQMYSFPRESALAAVGHRLNWQLS